MSVRPITIKNFQWGLNLSTTSEIGDNQFSVAKNMSYNAKGQIQTRYWMRYFWNAIGSNKPVTSVFFFQRDDTLATMLLAASWTDMYKYDEVTQNFSSIHSWLAEFETITWRTTRRTRRDFAVYKNVVYLCNWVNPYASYNWTAYTEYAGQPKYRYNNMTTDRLFWSWEDTNPSTIYYTTAAPTDWAIIDTNTVVVGWDELGRINWMSEYGKIILAMKSGKIYSIDVTNEVADPIDCQTWWFSDRTISTVWNSLVYLTERWVDTLQTRLGVTWAQAIETRPLDEDVRELTNSIQELHLNCNCWRYIKKLSNYFISFDTNADNIPDTTLVYNAFVKAWTQYTYPNFYDYGMYINAQWEYQYLAASATSDRLIEIEVGFDDFGELIEHELKTKSFDFGEPWSFKTYDYIDVIGTKSKNKEIEVNIEVDWITVWGWMITDAMIIETKPRYTLGVRPIGIDNLVWPISDNETVDVYEYVARIPLFVTWSSINFSLKSNWGTWTLDKARIWVNWEPIDVFWYANIV